MTKTVGFGGGCHWCTEAVFSSLKGVTSVRQGWIASYGKNDSLSEAALVEFDSDEIPFDILIEIHLYTHASTSEHSMRGKYRSAVYVSDENDFGFVRQTIAKLQSDFDMSIITQALPLVRFEESREELRDYYYTDAHRPFCKNYIAPKLKLLRARFLKFADEAKIGVL